MESEVLPIFDKLGHQSLSPPSRMSLILNDVRDGHPHG